MESGALSALKEWFHEEKRPLPWRGNPSAYAVWVSEVMLQQTQASVVVPYFERWMHRFPSLAVLASAQIDEVIKLWEGLGYYSRARYLHSAAQYVVKTYGDELPRSAEEWAKIKGVGPYTVGAILSFAFHQKAVAVDANVARVISRYFLVEEEISSSRARKKVVEHTEACLDDEEPWVVMEALIELGAQVCKRVPQCSFCPVQNTCLARKMGKTRMLPFKKQKEKLTELTRHVCVIEQAEEVLLRRGLQGKVMADLYEFPYIETKEKISGQDIEVLWGQKAIFCKRLPEVKHSFTRFRAHLIPTLWKAQEKGQTAGCEWIRWDQVDELPFSAGHRKILKQLRG